MRRATVIGVTAALLAAVALGALLLLLLRPAVSVPSSVRAEVTIECAAPVGLDAGECGSWGDEILAEDAAPRTFEREDLRRLRIDRGILGFADTCRVEYFVSRYPDSAVWTNEIPCR